MGHFLHRLPLTRGELRRTKKGLQRRRTVAVDRLRQPFSRLGVQLEIQQQPFEVLHLAHNQLKLFDARCLQRPCRERQHLRIRCRCRAAQQLHPCLPEFALLPPSRLDVAKDAAGIAVPLRERRVVQPRADQPRHGNGHVRPQGQHAAIPIQKPTELRLQLPVAPRREGVGILKGRGDYIAVAPPTKNLQKRRFQATPRICLGPKIVGNSRRNLACARPCHRFALHQVISILWLASVFV